MKLTKEVIEEIESSDAYYVITVKDKTNFTYMDGKYADKKTVMAHIVQGMLGTIDDFLKDRKASNSMLLTLLVRMAIKAFPELKD